MGGMEADKRERYVKGVGKSVMKDLSEMCVIIIRSLGDGEQGINYIQENLVRVIVQLRDEQNRNE